MPQYEVTDPSSGTTLTLDGDSEPTEKELEEIFSSHKAEPELSPPIPMDQLMAKKQSYFEPQQGLGPLTTPVTGAPNLVRHPESIPEGIYNTVAKGLGQTLSPVGLGMAALAPVEAARIPLTLGLGAMGAKSGAEIVKEQFGGAPIPIPGFGFIPTPTPGLTPGQRAEGAGDLLQSAVMVIPAAAKAAHLPLAAEAAIKAIKERTQDAIKEGQVEGGGEQEHIGTEAQRLPTEAGGGNRPEPSPQVQPPPEGQAADPLLLKQSESVTPPVTEPSKGVAASVRNKWANATDENFGSEAGFINIDPIKDLVEKASTGVTAAYEFLKELPKEELKISKMDDYRKAVLNWSMKQQRSFQEAADAQKEITEKVSDPVRREGVTNWIQANGDPAVLANRLAATTDPKLRKGYEAALNLTPDEIGVANDVRNAYSVLGNRGFANGVLNNFKQNYVTQVWDLKKGPAMGSSRTLKDRFRFNKASTFDTFFDGEQAGYTPKTKDISKLLPVYLHEMNQVIAARQLVKEMSAGSASDGRPLVAPRGSGRAVTGPSGPATLLNPHAISKADTSDYMELPNQPALHGWRWATKDSAGNPVFMKEDLLLHPEAYAKLKNVLGKSAIAEWYSSPGSLAAKIPKAIVQGLDMVNSTTKKTMLGLVSPFHQVQEGTHAVGHRVNPTFNIPKVDLVNNTAHMDAAAHGLMLQPDRASANQFMDGLRPSGLVSSIPIVGQIADKYSNYLFHEYIPGLKYKTYEAILARNQKVYARDIASGEVTMADVKHLSAEQANAAYGHLNYTDLARNPTIQHIMRLGLLAPDFLEARARFAGQAIKGIGGAKVGREQILALATLALGQAAVAYTSSKLSGGEWDEKHPFEFHVGNRRYSMRSVPEDVSSLLNDWHAFVYSRISPEIGKGIMQYATRTDYRGRKVSAAQTTKELLQQPIPISVRGFLGVGRSGLSGWEQLASSVGLRISRYSPSTDVFDMAKKWMDNNPDPKIKARAAREQATVYPESEYKPLRLALQDKDNKTAKEAYKELLKTKTPSMVYKALSHPHAFTGSAVSDAQFSRSLNPAQKRIFEEAKQERRDVFKRYLEMLKEINTGK